jgi:S1-C subfamily serine protease
MVGLVSTPLGDEVPLDAPVEILKSRDSDQLNRFGATVTEAGIYTAATSSYSLASYLLKVQASGLGWSEPVMAGGKLVALTTGQDSNYVYALPAPLLRHFLEDRHDAAYRGFPTVGVTLTPLVSPQMRRLLKVDGPARGLRVAAVSPRSSFAGQLQEGDVLVALDGVEVNDHGYYNHPLWGRIHLKYLLNRHFGGDKVRLTVLRGGSTREIEGTLSRFDSNDLPVRAYRYSEAEPHLIFGGLLFEELSQGYLKQWGREWRDVAPYDLTYTLDFANDPTGDTGERVVFLARVLADAFNRGYDDRRNAVVVSVNGKSVHSLADLRAALAAPVVANGREYARIQLAREGGEIVLGYDELAAAHERIARTYEVRSPDSFFTRPGH